MYIVKNALKCIGRSKGRQILIGVIVLVIAVSACLGLSIRQAADSAREDTLASMSVTATISFDRQSMMAGMRENSSSGQSPGGMGGGFDRTQFANMMGQASSLTLEEYQTYAAASTVKDFFYTLSASFNGADDLEPVSTDTSDTTADTSSGDASAQPAPGGFGGNRVMGGQSDFSVEGVSGESAMTAFLNGTAAITDGRIFTEGGTAYECILSEELAAFNGLAVGDTVTLTNPNNEEETYPLTVVGLYADSSANQDSFSMMGMTATDPANKIYMSHAALQAIVDASAKVSTTQTDSTTGRTYDTALTGMLNATYSFATIEDYEVFEEEVRELGLDDSYTVSSADIAAFEASLTPLNTLSTMAGYFLLVILIIGAIILIVLNIFNVRERKYEIGVLTAMGMKKSRVALQFLTEIFVVTLAAVIIGVGIGAVSAVPVTNALLENQVTAQQNQSDRVEQSFGRGDSAGGNMAAPGNMAPSGGMGDRFASMLGGAADYVTEINAAMNFTVVLQMLGIAVLLTLAAGIVSMLFVMRYEPLKILANRD